MNPWDIVAWVAAFCAAVILLALTIAIVASLLANRPR